MSLQECIDRLQATGLQKSADNSKAFKTIQNQWLTS